MVRTSNLNIRGVTPIIAPSDLQQVFPLTPEGAEHVARSRTVLQDIIHGRDSRLAIVLGPCSIHDTASALEYADRLADLSKELDDQLLLVMRAYFEKPRTTIGWKGLINDPDLNGTHQISKGLGIARKLLLDIVERGLPIACEMLDPITPQFVADTISWGAIGARTTESQTHREMASGLSFPVGFKNGTDGNLTVATNAMSAALHPHSFLGINHEGRTSIVKTDGNNDVHIVLRGGSDGPNYSAGHIARTEELLAKSDLAPAIMVDCSHANSDKDHNKQERVVNDVVEQIVAGNRSIFGLMLESHLNAGNQSLNGSPEGLAYGVSITDKCIDWETTERLLRHTHAELTKCGGRPLG